MSPITGALWGLAGGAAVELLQLSADIRAVHRWPWQGLPNGMWPDLIAIGLRIVVAMLVTSAAAAGGQFGGPFGAFGFGVAAPLVVERMSGALARPHDADPHVDASARPVPVEHVAGVTTDAVD